MMIPLNLAPDELKNADIEVISQNNSSMPEVSLQPVDAPRTHGDVIVVQVAGVNLSEAVIQATLVNRNLTEYTNGELSGVDLSGEVVNVPAVFVTPLVPKHLLMITVANKPGDTLTHVSLSIFWP
jgi:hypothetical protein